MTFKLKSAVRLALAVLVVVLARDALIRWLEVIDVSPLAQPSGLTSDPAPQAAVGEPRFRVLPLIELRETRERPLFSKNRKPPDPAKVEADTVAAPPPPDVQGIRLVGLMRTESKTAKALIRLPSALRADWVSAGAELGGWIVHAIEKDKVVLQRDGTRIDLVLRSRRPEEAGD